MPFGGEGGVQFTVAVRGWSSDTIGGSTGPGSGSKRETNKFINKLDKCRIRGKVCGKRKLSGERSRGIYPKELFDKQHQE